MVLVHRRQNPVDARKRSAAPRSVGVNWLSAAVGATIWHVVLQGAVINKEN